MSKLNVNDCEWLRKKVHIKNEFPEITYIYWDDTGHRRMIQQHDCNELTVNKSKGKIYVPVFLANTLCSHLLVSSFSIFLMNMFPSLLVSYSQFSGFSFHVVN